MKRTALALVLLTLVVVLAARLMDSRTSTPEQAAVATPKNSDYYMLDAVVQQMDATGAPEYRMTAKKVLHYPNNSARLTDIHVNYLGGAQSQWKLRAALGTIPAGKRDILLHDGVTVTGERQGRPSMHLCTERAWVRPDRDQVDTTVAVSATSQGQQASAIGMTIDLKQNRVILDKHVQVTYQP